MWSGCPQAWKLKYVDGHKFDDSSIHNIFGTSMHEVIQDWLGVLYNKSEVMARTMYLNDIFKEKLISLFKEHVTVGETGEKIFLADKDTLMEFYNHGCQILEYIQKNYKKLFPTENVSLHSIEYPLEIEVKKNVMYVGFIDIVTYDSRDETYVLYDLKTSRTGWTDYQKKDPVKIGQLLLYKKFFAEQMNVPEANISVEFVILKRTISENSMFTIPRVSKFSPSNGKPSLNKNWTSFQKFIDSCFDDEGNYISEQKANPSKNNCRFCSFRDKKGLCPEGINSG